MTAEEADINETPVAGPVLLARGTASTTTRLSALVVTADHQNPPDLAPEDQDAVTPLALATAFGWTVWRYDFALLQKAGGARYALYGQSWRVQTDPNANNFRIGYVSCNGFEGEDLFHPAPDRNVLWRRLLDGHGAQPLTLLLHGGDQFYADGVWHCHPELAGWDDLNEDHQLSKPLSNEAFEAARHFYWSHYIRLLSQPEVAPLVAEVPSLMMWDDHDIFDGWGSHGDGLQQSQIWQGVYAAAREGFLLFQLGGTDEHPPTICEDRDAPGGPQQFGWCCRYGETAIVAPDLRAERTAHRVMGDGGWTAINRWKRELTDCRRVFVMSSVPALGPRLSWIERTMLMLPRAQRYEDDLRDQWQSRAHRREWQAFLQTWLDLMAAGPDVTLISGEIHLATRGEMHDGARKLHQLVASGIAHPPPPTAYARVLGGLAWLGEAPLTAHPIMMRPLPGRRYIYTNIRNYLMLERTAEGWSAWWEIETDGASAHLTLGKDR